jgi:hypothetical protein
LALFLTETLGFTGPSGGAAVAFRRESPGHARSSVAISPGQQSAETQDRLISDHIPQHTIVEFKIQVWNVPSGKTHQ